VGLLHEIPAGMESGSWARNEDKDNLGTGTSPQTRLRVSHTPLATCATSRCTIVLVA
jgi:hypothetical protein